MPFLKRQRNSKEKREEDLIKPSKIETGLAPMDRSKRGRIKKKGRKKNRVPVGGTSDPGRESNCGRKAYRRASAAPPQVGCPNRREKSATPPERGG